MHTFHTRPLTLAFASLALSAALGAQEAAEPAPAAAAPIATKDEVSKAVGAAFGSASAHFTGSVSKKAAKSDNPMSAMIMGPNGSRGGDAFEGEVEVLRRDGHTLIASVEDLPGIAVFESRDRRRVTTTTLPAQEQVGTKTLSGDFPDLLTTDRLIKEIERAEWSFVRDTETGAITATARLRARLIKARGDAGGGMGMGMMGSMQPSVEHVDATLSLDANKALQSLRFEVVRFDPQSVMMRRFMENAQDGGTVEMGEADFDFEKDKTAADLFSDIYTLKAAAAEAASPRAERLFEDFSELTK